MGEARSTGSPPSGRGRPRRRGRECAASTSGPRPGAEAQRAAPQGRGRSPPSVLRTRPSRSAPPAGPVRGAHRSCRPGVDASGRRVRASGRCLMAARIAGVAAKANQALQFHSVQFGGLPNRINGLGVVQGRLLNVIHKRFSKPSSSSHLVSHKCQGHAEKSTELFVSYMPVSISVKKQPWTPVWPTGND
jgi:hypothetical protein